MIGIITEQAVEIIKLRLENQRLSEVIALLSLGRNETTLGLNAYTNDKKIKP